MKKKNKAGFIVVTILFVGIGIFVLQNRLIGISESNRISLPPSVPAPPTTSTLVTINLPVPFIPEVADGRWIPPWNNACEEASIIMVESYFLGNKPVNRRQEEAAMRPLFDWEVKKFGSHADTDAVRTAKIINEYSSFNAHMIRRPTIEQIKAELAAGRPVISFHYGYGLNNPLLRFRRGGSSYHVSVLVGYDEEKKEFIMNDTGHIKGLDWRYTYDTIFSTLHDYDHVTHRADGVPTVLFTSPKQIVKAPGRSALYLLEDGKKRYITHPRIFKNHRWSWDLIKEMNAEELSNIPTGEPISQ